MHPQIDTVLAVHWQRDIVTREGAFGAIYGEMVQRTGVVGRTAGVLASARERGIPIFYTRVCFRDDYSDLVANSPLFELVGQSNALVDGSPGAEIVPELAPRAGDVVVSHTRVAGTAGTDLIRQLRARDVMRVAILGVSTNLSVESTARNLADAGFDVYVVADCCTSSTQEAHDASIETLGLLTRKIVGADDLMTAFSGVGAA
ncbi:MAG: cysteine hydrolase [Chloroflexi bacterium]|nr:cysteine hydrolase [Chloroflexota bacterium]